MIHEIGLNHKFMYLFTKSLDGNNKKLTMEIKMTSDACREKITLENYICSSVFYLHNNKLNLSKGVSW